VQIFSVSYPNASKLLYAYFVNAGICIFQILLCTHSRERLNLKLGQNPQLQPNLQERALSYEQAEGLSSMDVFKN